MGSMVHLYSLYLAYLLHINIITAPDSNMNEENAIELSDDEETIAVTSYVH